MNILHCKAIIDGLLYDTKTAKEFLSYKDNDEIYTIFVTPNFGEYFLVRIIENNSGNDYDIAFTDIKPLTENECKAIVGIHSPDTYISFFGNVREA